MIYLSCHQLLFVYYFTKYAFISTCDYIRRFASSVYMSELLIYIERKRIQVRTFGGQSFRPLCYVAFRSKLIFFHTLCRSTVYPYSFLYDRLTLTKEKMKKKETFTIRSLLPCKSFLLCYLTKWYYSYDSMGGWVRVKVRLMVGKGCCGTSLFILAPCILYIKHRRS
jgi:hypothetical protein